MSKGVNKAFILGNLGKDPEIREASNGTSVVSFSVATSEEWKDKNTGEKREKAEWHRIVIFGRLAEVAGKYLKKGSQVYLEGKVQTRKWKDQSGNDRYTTEIVAHKMELLGGGGMGVDESSDPRKRVSPGPDDDASKEDWYKKEFDPGEIPF